MPARLSVTLTTTVLAITVASAACAQPLAIAGRGVVVLPTTTADQHGVPFTIAGLSGITHRAGDEYLAVMDNSNKLVRLQVTLNGNGSIATASVLGGISLAQSRDFEGIAIGEFGTSRIWLAEEGTPAIHEYSLTDGALVRTIATPPVFLTRRDNFGFESLTTRSITGEIWTANEEALVGDGPTSSTSAGTVTRLQRFFGASPTPVLQFALRTQPIHGAAISGSRSGLSDLVILPSGRMLALERSLALSAAGLFQTRIYELDVNLATDTSLIPTLDGESFTTISKRLLFQGSLNNLEGLCLGPKLATGRYAMLGVIDDGDPISVNAIAAFELTGAANLIACRADVNDDGALSVQDLFDFIAEFFQDSVDADVNGSSSVTVQDLFDFLALYFSACR